MEDLRCRCGKLLCRFDGAYIVVKCRHCKRLVRIKGGLLTAVEYTDEVRKLHVRASSNPGDGPVEERAVGDSARARELPERGVNSG